MENKKILKILMLLLFIAFTSMNIVGFDTIYTKSDVYSGNVLGYKNNQFNMKLPNGDIKILNDSKITNITFAKPQNKNQFSDNKDNSKNTNKKKRTPTGHGFYFKNVHFQSEYDWIMMLGEIINHSGNNYKSVSFNISIYDDSHNLIAKDEVHINNFKNGQTKSFGERITDASYSEVEFYKIQYDSSY